MMKVQLLRDQKGQAIASVNETPEDPTLVPLNMEIDDGGKVEELEVHSRDLLDVEGFYQKIAKK